MPKIVIIEKDETTPGPVAESTDVVYIPGLVDTNQLNIQRLIDAETEEYEYVGIQPNTPTLFTSVKQFESLCGNSAATFKEDQYYSDLEEVVGNTTITGFAVDAIPYHRIMFEAGTSDPSYIMAKECLSAGLNVLFERINGDPTLEKVTTEPADWEANKTNYYIEETIIQKIDDAVYPLWYRPATASEISDIANVNKLYTLATTVITNADQTTTETKHFVPYNGSEQGENTVYIRTTDYYRKDDYVEVIIPTDNIQAGYIDGVTEYWYYNQGIPTPLSETGIESAEAFAIAVGAVNGATIYRTLETPQYVPITKVDDRMLHVSELVETYGINWVKDYHNYYEYASQKRPCTFTDRFDSGTIYENNDGLNIRTIYRALQGIYSSDNPDGLADKGNYSIKYLTSGAYPVYEYNNNSVTTQMLDLAEARGDCVAFIDHTDSPQRERNTNIVGNVYYNVKKDNVFSAKGEFGTMFTPWASYNRITTDKTDDNRIKLSGSVRMPASFAYFMALADSIKTNANWLAIAGSARGVVPNLATDGMTTNIPNGTADLMQPRDGIAINAITNIKPYGWTIWGNRTLKTNSDGNLTATSFLNIRNLISDVKKTTYRVARRLTFEQNNDILWVNFKGLISPTLDRMLTGYGISGYKIVRDTQHERASEKATVCAKIILYPTYAVEDFYITVVLKDDEVNVE